MRLIDNLLDEPLLSPSDLVRLRPWSEKAAVCAHPREYRSVWYDGRFGCKLCGGWCPKLNWWQRLISRVANK